MKNPTQKKQLSRYYPKKGSFPKSVIRDRDRTIMSLVYEHRFLDTTLLWHLLRVQSPVKPEYRVGKDGKKRPRHYGFGEKALYKRLQTLFHERYLDRHLITDEPIGRGYGSPRAIYGLGPRSPTPIAELFGISAQEIRNIVLSNKVKSPFLRHAIEIATFRVTLELACQASDDTIKILFWEQGQILRDSVFGLNEKGEEEKYSVYPDAFFAVSVKGKGTANYFLELDRGTMPILSSGRRADIRKKILGFWYYNKQKKHSRRYFHSTLPTGQIVGLGVNDLSKTAGNSTSNGAGIKGFRVLFLTPGTIDAGGIPNGRIANILSAFGQLESVVYPRNSLFWFTPLNRFDIENPQSIFSQAWVRPNMSNGLGSLIE